MSPTTAHASYSPTLVEQGRYLATAADCTACHTAQGGPEFSGGYALASPLGPIVATNITPSMTHGIGNYSEAQFAAALQRGIRADGAHLYPAMPYTAYALLSDADIQALYAYFMTSVVPVDRPGPETRLPFPFNLRTSMAVWNAFFLDDARFVADRSRSSRWNRGAYLVQALGHCSACHSPRGLLMQEDQGRALGGTQLGGWYAPNITSDPVSGIGGWSIPELVAYLGTGVASGKGRAAGGMAEVVEHSLSQLTAGDLLAIATYLKTVPAVVEPNTTRAAFSVGEPARLEPGLRGAQVQGVSGAALYSGLCASCHGASGVGTSDLAYPSLYHETSVGSARPDNLIAVILNGVDRTVGGDHVAMPGFGSGSYVQVLDDMQVAAIATFVRGTFGPGGVVTTADVATTRAGGPKSPLLGLFYGIVISASVIVIGFVGWWLRRKSPS